MTVLIIGSFFFFLLKVLVKKNLFLSMSVVQILISSMSSPKEKWLSPNDLLSSNLKWML